MKSKKEMIKILSVIFSLVLSFGAVSVVAHAEEIYKYAGNTYTYNVLNDGTAEITSFSGTKPEKEIPRAVGGYTVSRIGNNAYTGLTVDNEIDTLKVRYYPTGFYFPETTVSIGNSAYKNCTFERNIMYMPQALKRIEDSAFENCSSLKCISFYPGLESIGDNAFSGCTGLSSIDFFGTQDEWNNVDIGTGNECLLNATINFTYDYTNYGVEILPDDTIELITYYNPDMLSMDNSLRVDDIPQIIFNRNVTSLGEWFIADMGADLDIVIPENITHIHPKALVKNYSVVNVTVDENNPVYDSRNNCKAIIETDTGKLVFGCKNTVIPTGVTSIGDYAFYSCKIRSLTIPEGIVSIGEEAFCVSNLKNYNLPSSLRYIGNGAFSHTLANYITLPGNLEYIGDTAFWGCRNIKSITIPASVTHVGAGAFSYCASLNTIKVNTGNSVYDSRENCNAIIKTDTNELVGGCKSTVIPDGITAIGSDVFRWSEITEITIPNSVQRIDDRAFDCSKITDVYFMGTEEQWNRILIGSDNRAFNNATIHYLAPDILGDADGNGTLDINDATLIQKHLASLETVSEDKLDLCDTDKDGYVSIKDVTLIQKYLVGLTESL